ncbi:acyl-[acyl-carrier-protein] thioesterase [Clostridium oryzae]|nr:acyl-ACP thioesterase domain-containing protein [Clostridium oryzae]
MEKKSQLKEYEIHYYEVDYNKRMNITSLINFLQDTATYQSDKLGVGIDYLIENNMAWVIYKWDIKLYKYPVYGEKIIIKTVPYGLRKFYAYRKFEVCNAEGELIADADSIWFLLSLDKKRPLRVGKEMYTAYGIDEDCKDTIEINNIDAIDKVENEKMFHVRYEDIDTNRHVNNVKYVSWAIEALPVDIVENNVVSRIKINYMKETTYGEEIKSKVLVKETNDELMSIHSIEGFSGKELTRLEIYWKNEL